jgi:putative membrane protein
MVRSARSSDRGVFGCASGEDWGWDWGWGGGMFFGPLFMIAGPVLLIVLIRWFSRTAREILDERYAKGEIQRDEYEERRKALGA